MQSLTPYQRNLPAQCAKNLASLFSANEIEKAVFGSQYSQYRDDPVGFGQEILYEAYAEDIIALMESVRDNQITIAQSCNAFGKTHCAARIGAGVAPELNRKKVHGVPCKVSEKANESLEIGVFDRLRDQLWWMCREWLRTSEAMLPPDEELVEELSVPTYKVENGRTKVMRKDVMKELLKRSPNRADSLCLTFFEHQQAFDPIDLESTFM